MERIRRVPVSQWALWNTSKRIIALVFLVDGAALFLTIQGLVDSSVTYPDLLRFGILAAMAVGYYEASLRVGQARRFFAVGTESRHIVHVNMTSVCTLPAAVLLPNGLASFLVAALYLHLWLRASEHEDSRPFTHRFVYSVATMLLACGAVAGLLGLLHAQIGHRSPGWAALVLVTIAIPTFFVVESIIVAAAIYLSTGTKSPAGLLGTRAENLLEVTTLVLAALTTLSLLHAPWAAVLVLPAVFLLQHQALLRQLVEAATLDGKTALLNATAWRQLAHREFLRAGQRGGTVALLVLDMDRFKQLNDSYGHLAGDAALKVVGEALAEELRGYDAVGRFGGEEFVAVLPDTEVQAAEQVAQRLRRRIERLELPIAGAPEPVTVTTSIGVAACPEHGDSLETVLGAADAAMYEAKRAGRNTVRTAQDLALTGRSQPPAAAAAS